MMTSQFFSEMSRSIVIIGELIRQRVVVNLGVSVSIDYLAYFLAGDDIAIDARID